MPAIVPQARLRAWDIAAAALFVAVAAALHAPLLPHLTTHIPSDVGDPLLNTWILWWNAHVPPWSPNYWHAPAFAPAPYALTLSETLLGLTPLTTPAQWLGATPLVAYNLLFILTPFFNGCAAYALARTLTGRGDAALVGGLAFMLAPYRAAQLPHVQTLATFYMPAALLALHRYWQTGGRRWLVCLWVTTIANGLVSGYHLVYFTLPLGVALVWMAASCATWRRPAAVAITLAAALAALLPILLPYQSVHERWDLRRTIGEMQAFSADVASFTAAAPALWLKPLPKLIDIPEADVYPGLTTLVCLALGLAVWWRAPRTAPLPDPAWARVLRSLLLVVAAVAGLTAFAGWFVGPFAFGWGPLEVSVTSLHKPFGAMLSAVVLAALASRRVRDSARRGGVTGLYATVLIASVVLMLGPEGQLMGERVWYKAPGAWLLELPGFDTVRVPARWATIQILSSSVLCALAVAAWQSRSRRAHPAVIGLVCAGLVVEGHYRLPLAMPPAPLPVSPTADLVVELPTRGWIEDVAAMYHGMSHGRPVVNGYSGYGPPHYAWLSADLQARCFASLDALRRGRSIDVLIHATDAEGPATLNAARRQWPMAVARTLEGVVLLHVAADSTRASSAYDDPIDLSGFCEAARAAAPKPQ